MNLNYFYQTGIYTTGILLSINSIQADSLDSISYPFRPNIVWITCEDLSPFLSFYGDSSAKTPNLDRLAAQGIRFTNAYSVAGVSAPSRCGIITGCYPTSIGGHNMRTLGNKYESVIGIPSYSIVTPDSVKCFSEYLRAAGYYCTNNAKTDYQFEAPLSAWDENSHHGHWGNRKPGQPFFPYLI